MMKFTITLLIMSPCQWLQDREYLKGEDVCFFTYNKYLTLHVSLIVCAHLQKRASDLCIDASNLLGSSHFYIRYLLLIPRDPSTIKAALILYGTKINNRTSK